MTRLLPISALLALLVAGSALIATRALARDIVNTDLRYSVAIPDTCSVEQTTGTIEAVCATAPSAAGKPASQKAASFFLELDAEIVPPDARPYGDAEFRADIPDAVCGAGEPADVRIDNVAETPVGSARVFTASVVCPAIPFLGLEQRRAAVRYVIAQKMRYRLMYRAPVSMYDTHAATGRAFLASFKTTAE
ncbi:MAG TPA: hypothetical protein PK970_00500 [Hyphomicrobiaceae bacterium]|nr:hypothetical protein [Hyphomicrobiaceae bacterium]